MRKHCVLVSGPLISKDNDLIKMLKKAVLVLANSKNRQIMACLAEYTIDAILLEISENAPEEISLIEEIKKHSQHTKIIVINGDRDLFVKAYKLGAKDVFRKPYRREMVAERVIAVLA